MLLRNGLIATALLAAMFSVPAFGNANAESKERASDFQKRMQEKLERAETGGPDYRHKGNNSDSATGAGPIGFAIGESTLSDVRSRFDDKHIKVVDTPNGITGGKSLIIESSEIPIKGVAHAFFIFEDDADETLVAVSMIMEKGEYNRVKEHLSEKYELIDEQFPSSGKASAHFKAHKMDQRPKVYIEIKYDKKQKGMVLEYRTFQFHVAMLRSNKEAERTKRERERSRF